MSKDPLVTRSQLRRYRDQEMREKQAAEREFQEEEKRIENHYRKELKKNKGVTASRSSQNQRSRQMNSFLMKWIVIVGLLLILVLVMVFYL